MFLSFFKEKYPTAFPQKNVSSYLESISRKTWKKYNDYPLSAGDSSNYIGLYPFLQGVLHGEAPRPKQNIESYFEDTIVQIGR